MKRSLSCFMVILLLSTACATDEISESDIPVMAFSPDDTTVDIYEAIDNATEEVTRILPDAQLGFFSFTGQCSTLAEFEGDVSLSFTQTRWTLFGQRIAVAWAVIDTTQESMSVTIRDETEHYPNTDLLTFEGIPIAEIASSVTAYLTEVKRCDGIIVLDKSSSDGPWGVRCGLPEEVFIHCIEIDPMSGQVTDFHR